MEIDSHVAPVTEAQTWMKTVLHQGQMCAAQWRDLLWRYVGMRLRDHEGGWRRGESNGIGQYKAES